MEGLPVSQVDAGPAGRARAPADATGRGRDACTQPNLKPPHIHAAYTEHTHARTTGTGKAAHNSGLGGGTLRGGSDRGPDPSNNQEERQMAALLHRAA